MYVACVKDPLALLHLIGAAMDSRICIARSNNRQTELERMVNACGLAALIYFNGEAMDSRNRKARSSRRQTKMDHTDLRLVNARYKQPRKRVLLTLHGIVEHVLFFLANRCHNV